MLVTGYNLIQFPSPLTVKNGLFNINLNFMASFQTFKHVVSNLYIYTHISFFTVQSTYPAHHSVHDYILPLAGC